ncbi:hypothetical protein [Streptomyces sp. NPDC056713]
MRDSFEARSVGKLGSGLFLEELLVLLVLDAYVISETYSGW